MFITRISVSLLAVSLLIVLAGSAHASAIYRINVGGPAVTSVDAGIDWAEDSSAAPSTHLTAGGTNFYNTTQGGSSGPVTTGPAGVPLELFQTERWDAPGADEMSWTFSVAAGTYEVRLHLAEIYGGVTASGQRSFDVSVEGAVPGAFDDIDPFAVAGLGVGFVLTSTHAVTDGSLDLVFLHDIIENPAVKGIEIVAVPEPTTALLLAGGLFALGRRARRMRA